jgi:hypothetical protein
VVQVLDDAAIDVLIRWKREEGFAIEVGSLARVSELRPPQEVEPSALVCRRHNLAIPAFSADLIEERELIIAKPPCSLVRVLVVERARRRRDADPNQACYPIRVRDRVENR